MWKILLVILVIKSFRCVSPILSNRLCWKQSFSYYYRNEQVCCEGFKQVSSLVYSHALNGYYDCQPICKGGCKNGECRNPEDCRCPDGTKYVKRSNGDTICEFVCNPPCLNGECIKGNVCSCKSEYTLSENNVCAPVCKPSCINSECVSPNVCKCHENYSHSLMANVCNPQCEKCTNGDCVEPNKCICHEGYAWDINEGDCKPFCEPECLNGVCLGSNVCSCNKGYILDEINNFCLPVCEPQCENSECLRPNYCKCHSNHTKHPNEFNKCLPICQPPCVNGECIQHNTCSCFPGYRTNYVDVIHRLIANNTTIEKYYFNECHPVCDKCSNGNCTMPGKCECNNGYEWDYEIGDCKPNCDPSCENSVCIDPNECKCNEGFTHTTESHVCKEFSTCDDDCSLPAVCETGCNTDENITTSSQDQILTCKYDGYFIDNITGLCKPVCQPPCVNSKCVAPDVCWCENVSYKPSSENKSHLCILESCKKSVDIKITIKESPFNKTCFKAAVLNLYDINCPTIIANNSCYDVLCVNDSQDICHKYYTCDIANVSLIHENHCHWTVADTNETNVLGEGNYGLTDVMENILHSHVREKLCLPCLCPINKSSELCSDDKINYQLCTCPKENMHRFTSSGLISYWVPVSLLTILLLVICIALLSTTAYFILKNKVLKKNSEEYIVEAYINNTYGVTEESCSADTDHMYAEIKGNC